MNRVNNYFPVIISKSILIAINVVILILLLGLPLVSLISNPEDLFNTNLVDLLILVGLALMPITLLLSEYLIVGDPFIQPVCIIGTVYNAAIPVILFVYSTTSQVIDAFQSFSSLIGIIAIFNALALILRLRKEHSEKDKETGPDFS